ncbi:hypothetical protein, partial [Phormidium sp. CCY1219]|uniref:hypothetical protein n=1 Tax=Phormidium sp. CCY1219 TaxID=2886104 RepID=UPI002D1EF542
LISPACPIELRFAIYDITPPLLCQCQNAMFGGKILVSGVDKLMGIGYNKPVPPTRTYVQCTECL